MPGVHHFPYITSGSQSAIWGKTIIRISPIIWITMNCIMPM